MCAVLSSVCATTVDNSGVYVYYLKGTVSVCFRCPARTVGFSGTRLYLCILQSTKLSDAQVLPTSWLGGTTRGLQPDGHIIGENFVKCPRLQILCSRPRAHSSHG